MPQVITGRVLDAGGRPIAGATVAIASSDQPHRDVAVLSDADGAFRLGGLQPGRYAVEARHAGIVARADAHLAAPDDATVEIRLG